MAGPADDSPAAIADMESSSACALALSKPGLSGDREKSGLLIAYVGDLGALGELKWFRRGRSRVPPSTLKACVRGVMGYMLGLLMPPVVPGVRGMGEPRVKAVRGVFASCCDWASIWA